MNNKRRSTEYNPEIYFSEKELPIAQAIRSENNNELKRLIKESDVNISQPGKMGYTYLLYAMQNKNYDAMEILLKGGADPNVASPRMYVPGAGEQDRPSINTCIATTAYNKYDIKYLKLLVKYRADVNNTEGSLALTKAIHYREDEKIDYLLRNGAKLNIVPHFGVTPIIAATANTQWDLVERLLDLGADPFLEAKGTSVKEDIEYYMSITEGTPDGNRKLAKLLKRLESMGMKIDYSKSQIKFDK